MSDNEQKFGLEGIEQSQGYEPMPIAHPAPSTDDLPTESKMTESELAHAKRPNFPEPEVREYRDVNTGEKIPANQTVTAEQASADIARAREQERQARDDQSNRDLADALDQLNARDQAQQPPVQQDRQPTALDELQPETAEAEAARSEVDAAWQRADEQITEFLKNDHIRERIQGEYD
jgi:hypothetical protein